MNQSPYICFYSDKTPFMTKNIVDNCNCIKTNPDNYKQIYLFYRNKYLEGKKNENLFLKIYAYDAYHDISSHGLTRMSKRILGEIAPKIYEFRKSIV